MSSNGSYKQQETSPEHHHHHHEQLHYNIATHAATPDSAKKKRKLRELNLQGAQVLQVAVPTMASLTSSGIPSFSQEDHCILLPYQNEPVAHFSLDIGGTLIKMVYFEPDSVMDTTSTAASDSAQSSSNNNSNNNNNNNGSAETGGPVALEDHEKLPPATVEESVPSVPLTKLGGGRLCFAKFETQNIDHCIQFIKALEQKYSSTLSEINATGGGAFKFEKRFKEDLGFNLHRIDEMQSLITGLNFLLKAIPNESFTYSKYQQKRYETVNPDDLYPYLLVNIGSGVSIIMVTGDNEYERISGSSLGGGTFWGLAHLLTNCDSFDEVLRMCLKGDNTKVDMLVGDIYGSDYSKVKLPANTIASSVGKTIRRGEDGKTKDFRPEDIARSLLFMISNNIGQIAYLNAMRFNLKRIYFGGFFIRDHPITMGCISYAINFWSQGSMQALFLKHEGYLGAIGAFIIDQQFGQKIAAAAGVLVAPNYGSSESTTTTSASSTPTNRSTSNHNYNAQMATTSTTTSGGGGGDDATTDDGTTSDDGDGDANTAAAAAAAAAVNNVAPTKKSRKDKQLIL